ncbi:MAG: hypothetical protein ACREDR_28130 [Blastocatellia bacterium]
MQGKRLQISWTGKHFEQLVKAAGDEYKQLYLACYVIPLLQAHPSASSILNRLEQDTGGTINFSAGRNSGIVVWPLICAHNLVLRTIDLHNDYFKLVLDAEIRSRADEFLAAWKK